MLVRLMVIGLVVAGLALLQGAPEAQAQAAPNDQTAVEPVTVNGCDGEQVTMKTREYEVLQKHNEYRASKGLRTFCVDVTLQKVAQAHSTDMAPRNFYSHTNPDGEGPGHRLTAAGYDCYPYGSENIGEYWMDNTAAEITQSWIDSTGHRANIENTHHTRIGIGSAYDADFSDWYYNDPYWGGTAAYTVNFAGNDCEDFNYAPSIMKVYPAKDAHLTDATPRISAVVKDPETNLRKSNIKVFVDGVRLSGLKYSYDSSLDKLSGTAPKLARGQEHTVRIVASDGDGKSASKTVRFTVVR